DDVEVRENQQSLRGIQTQILCANQKSRADPARQFLTDGRDGARAIQAFLPPCIGFGPLRAQNGFEPGLILRGPSGLSQLLTRHLQRSAWKLEQARAKNVDQGGAVRIILQVPDLRELAQRAAQVKRVSVRRAHVLAERLVNELPVTSTDAHFR